MEPENTQPQEPTTEQPEKAPEQPTPHLKEERGGVGPVIGIIIIIILLALGGFYYFTAGVDQISHTETEILDGSTDAPAAERDSVGTEEDALREQGSSTNLADIESDLNATDLSGLDEASADFEFELEQ